MKLMIRLTYLNNYFLMGLLLCLAAIPGFNALAEAEGEEEESFPIGEHGGRLFTENGLSVEILFYDRGARPVFRAWAENQDTAIAPGDWQLDVALTRLGEEAEVISFVAEGEFLVSSAAIEEPYSFEVELSARYAGRSFEWEFESFAGRVEINADMAEIVGIGTREASQGIIHQTVLLYGKISPDPQLISYVTARYPGLIESIGPKIGDEVRREDVLVRIEANDSLRTYEIRSPISGVVVERQVNPGEYAGTDPLLTVANYESVWAKLSVFPSDIQHIKAGQAVTLRMGDLSTESTIAYLNPGRGLSMQLEAVVPVSNPDLIWVPGMLIEADITIADIDVPLAIDNRSLQNVGGEQVIFIQVGDIYEARKLDLGITDGRLTEVLDGMKQGDRYVVVNSYLLKADLEKSLAADDD